MARIMIGMVIGLVGAAALLLMVLAVMSPGKPRPILADDGSPVPGSISEKAYINVNGDRQGLFIKGRDGRKPVLLYLHGGMPDYFLTDRYPTGLEDLFVVAWWEQRGSGISYHPQASKKPITLDAMVEDTLVVADYLRERFSVEKIYLMAHSGGTFVGIHAIRKAPRKFAAYVAVAQISNQLESEVLAYQHMLDAYRRTGQADMVRRLERTPVTIEGGVPTAYQTTRDVAMHRLGIGTMRSMHSLVTGLVLPSLYFPDYTLTEKYHFWAAKAKSGIAALWTTLLTTDLTRTVTTLDVPVYFLHGVHDYTCSYPLARKYLDALKAPVKGFYTFEESAHSPMFEEPSRTREILRDDVLHQRSDLADP